jgi:hypothetical protein
MNHLAKTATQRELVLPQSILRGVSWTSMIGRGQAGKEPGLKKLAIAIFALCLLEALCFFFTGKWASSLFRSSGATASQAFTAAQGEWTTGLLILIGGILHWVALASACRSPLPALAPY